MKKVCRKFTVLERDTLRGFATIEVVDRGLSIRDFALHEKTAARGRGRFSAAVVAAVRAHPDGQRALKPERPDHGGERGATYSGSGLEWRPVQTAARRG